MPMQIANMEAVKSMGYSNITLKLEIIKKVIEAVILVVSFMIGIKAIAWGVVVYNAVCLFINLYPNIKLIDYKISEQIKDVLPSLVISLLMGASVYGIQYLSLPLLVILLLQTVLGVIIYFCLSKVFKVEAFCYLHDFANSGMASRRNKE